MLQWKKHNVTFDAERLQILYTMLDGESKTAYNRHSSETDKSEALKGV